MEMMAPDHLLLTHIPAHKGPDEPSQNSQGAVEHSLKQLL